MSSQEYKDLVNYLVDKGVIARPEPLGFDPGEPVYIKSISIVNQLNAIKP